jgi:hypothetical protein
MATANWFLFEDLSMSRRKERQRSKRPKTRKRGGAGHLKKRQLDEARHTNQIVGMDSDLVENLGLPSNAEIRMLPRWAMVALGASCMQHVEPLFDYFWPTAPRQCRFAVESAIRLAAISAAHATTYVNEAEEAAEDAASAAKVAENADHGIATAGPSAYAAHIARGASHVAFSVLAASRGDLDNTAKRVGDCLRSAANAYGAATKDDGTCNMGEFFAKVAREYSQLKNQAFALGWTHDTGITQIGMDD